MKQYEQITTTERKVIAKMRQKRVSLRGIAGMLGRNVSSISREIRRNLSCDGNYRVITAQERTNARRRNSRKKPQFTKEQFGPVVVLLKEDWSPEQISNVLRMFRVLHISHETIYRYIRKNRRKGGIWWKHLRHSRKKRRKRYGGRDSRGVMWGKRQLEERPAGAVNRSRLGHYEIDTVLGKGSKNCILTLVDRKTGYLFIRKLKNRTTAEANSALIGLLKGKTARAKTITADNGTEFHQFRDVEARSRVQFYFCQPYHSWERGSNENTNGLIRQYLPKGKSMAKVTQEQCDLIANKLNSRPRKRFGYRTPEELHVGTKLVLHF